MQKIVVSLLFVYLFGFDPTPITANIISSTSHYGIIDKNISKMGGYLIQQNKIIAKVISLGNNQIKYLPFEKLQNRALATIKVKPQKGDKVIFGLYNFRALIIAPDQKSYLNIKNSYPNITFVDSDIFATYINTAPKKEDFIQFCRDYNVGIIDFILDKEYIVDCETFYTLEEKNTTIKPYSKPFFITYSKIKDAIFSSPPKSWIKYYKNMIKDWYE